MRANGFQVSGNVDRNILRLMRLQIVKFNCAKLFNDNGVRSGGGTLEVEAITVQGFAHLLRFSVVGKQADRTVAVGEEIDRVAYPHRIVVVGILARELLNTGVFKIENADRRSLAAVIALPCL